MNYQAIEILYVSDKLVVTRLPCTIWSKLYPFLKFCCYFTRQKNREISRKNMRNSGNTALLYSKQCDN